MKTCCNSSFLSSLQTSKCIYNSIYAQLKAHNKEGVVGWSYVRLVGGRVVGWPDDRMVG